VREVLDRARRIDVLVNNGGIDGGGAIECVPMDFAKAMFETNYFGAIRMIQAVLPGMRAQRSGAIRQRGLGMGASGRGRPRAGICRTSPSCLSFASATTSAR
jgi:NADP-dependent 3-hydroxy acid dehydrogenase YdfG